MRHLEISQTVFVFNVHLGFFICWFICRVCFVDGATLYDNCNITMPRLYPKHATDIVNILRLPVDQRNDLFASLTVFKLLEI